MSGVSIIGVGLHPFGRFGDKPAMDMGAEAITLALADAGIGWHQVQRGYAGSLEVSNPDAVIGKLGLTGIPFFGVFNGCATANTAITLAAESIEHGEADIAIAVGFDKHPRGAFAGDPKVLGLPAWYGETGLFLTTHFFGMKINRYMALYDISQETLAKVAAKNLRNGERNDECLATEAAERGDDSRRAVPELPADAVHVLRAQRGCSRGGPVSSRPGTPIHEQARSPGSLGAAHAPVRRLRAAEPVAACGQHVEPDSRRVQGGVREGRDRCGGRPRRAAAGH